MHRTHNSYMGMTDQCRLALIVGEVDPKINQSKTVKSLGENFGYSSFTT